METINLEDFLHDGIIKEESFRKKIETFNWKKFKNKKILIKGCASIPMPTWAYLIVTSQLIKNGSKVYYGEKCSAVRIG
tara:strand:- start:1488 stop:1724 length:237 start_codon:yes stop_codon:yes gene_type:complete